MENRTRQACMKLIDLSSLGNSAPNYDAYSFAKWIADDYNRKPGDLTGYDCPKCLNRGHFWVVEEDGHSFFRDCTCKELRRCRTRMKQSGLGDALDLLTFDSFIPRQDWQKNMYALAKRYAENPDGWLFFSGQPGCGKTHLCTAVCRRLLEQGKRVLYLPWQLEMAPLRFRDAQSREDKLEALRNAPVLYIDDFLKSGSQRPSDWELNIAGALINARYMSRRPTILSSEYSIDTLVSFDEAMASRIAERVGKNAMFIRPDLMKNFRLARDA